MELMTNKMTMSSLEISELLGSRHDSVVRAVERLAEKGVIEFPPMVEIPTATKPANVFVFSGEKGKRDTYVLVAQLSPEFTALIVDRWQQLENANKPQIPTNFADALQLAADQAKQLEQQAPKVNYFDKVVERENLLNATQVAQKLKMSAVKMNRYLDEMKVYNNAIKRGRAFQQWFVDKGYGVMRQTELGYAQPMFTLSGEAWIIECLTAEGVA
ncbi:MAG: phage antirepressor KilAC domain-containing protein [Wohlfahrtiimonas sp.]